MTTYRHKTVGTKVLDTVIEFATESGGHDAEVRLPETSLCWISKDSIDEFARELQELITKHAI